MIDELNGWADEILAKGDKPPPGFTPVPNSKVGLYHRKAGKGWEYWKAGTPDGVDPRLHGSAPWHGGKAEGDPRGTRITGEKPESAKPKPKPTKSDATSAETTLKQLGGAGRLKAMIGAKDFVYGTGWLGFKFKGTAKKGNYVKISVTPSDSYKLEFTAIRGLNTKVVKTFDDISASALKETFTKHTGLYLNL